MKFLRSRNSHSSFSLIPRFGGTSKVKDISVIITGRDVMLSFLWQSDDNLAFSTAGGNKMGRTDGRVIEKCSQVPRT